MTYMYTDAPYTFQPAKDGLRRGFAGSLTFCKILVAICQVTNCQCFVLYNISNLELRLLII